MKVAKKSLEDQKPVGPALAGKAVRVHATLHFKRPKSHFKKNGSLKSSAPKFVLKKPDVDNCLKFILDSLQPAVVVDEMQPPKRKLLPSGAGQGLLKRLRKIFQKGLPKNRVFQDGLPKIPERI